MGLRSPTISKGQRVMHDDFACLVLKVEPGKLTIRDKFGFQKEIPKKGAKVAKPS